MKTLSKLVVLSVVALLITVMSGQPIKAHSFEKGDYIDIRDDTTHVIKIMTYEEMIQELMTKENLSYVQAQLTLNKGKSLPNLVGYDGNISPAARSTYATLSSYVTVNSNYKPTINFYCETDQGGGSFRAIIRIVHVSLNRQYNNTSKIFSGTVFVNLEDPNRIYWIVNGDFYDNGSCTTSTGVDISLFGFVTLNFGGSYTSNHYAYCYKTGKAYF